MTGLARTDLTAFQKVILASLAVVGKGYYGGISDLAADSEFSRPTLYALAGEAEEVLVHHFDRPESRLRKVSVLVDEAQLRRTIVGLRCVGPYSIRDIEDVLPIIFPGVRVSYGKIQKICADAESCAAKFNTRVDLSEITAGALDEMFSQGRPVLAGVDLDTGYLFSLALRDSRSASDWAEVLGAAKEQGLSLDVVVKDAAKGIAAGVRKVFPEAEQRDDCFHAHYEMGKVRRILERRAYAAIAKEEEATKASERARRLGHGTARKLAAELGQARSRCSHAIEQFDRFELAVSEAQEAMEYVDLNNTELSDPDRMMEQIKDAGRKMKALDSSKCRKVGTYIVNRAEGLVLYMRELVVKLEALFPLHGETEVRLATMIWRLLLLRELKHHRWPAERKNDETRLLDAVHRLQDLAGDHFNNVLVETSALIERRHRASSAIEGFNAALRPYLYVHKGVTAGFLELFRAYYNLRTRRWGRHKGTSAHQLLGSGNSVDWLTELGYPPSDALH